VTRSQTVPHPPDAASDPGEPPARRRRLPVPDLLALLACLTLVPVVHAVGSIVHESYTLDEAWVAMSGKASLVQTRWVTASSPLGWTLLLRPFPVGGQAQRLVPLAFLAGSVLAGYAFGRSLGWRGRHQALLAGLLCAAAALLLPAQQLRHDLKQYTADAAVTVALLALLSWTEARWSRRRAAVLLVAMGAGALLSHLALATGLVVLAGLAVVALARRAWRQLLDIVVLGALTGAGFALVYLVVDKPGRTGRLYDYWAGFFPTARAVPGYLVHRLGQLAPVFGMPWPLFVLLAAAGIAVVAARGRPATAVAALLLPPGMVLAGVAQVYPLLDLRTSHFLFVTMAVLAAVAVAQVAAFAGRLVAPRWRTWAAAAVTVAAIGGYTAATYQWLRYPYVAYNWPSETGPTPPSGPTTDPHAQVTYLAAHRQPGDAIAINMLDQYAFAYYWSADRPAFVRGGPTAIHWYVRYPAGSGIVIATDRTAQADRTALTRALAASSGHRVWLVLSHTTPAETQAWQDAAAALHLRVVDQGPDALVLLTP
jgi:hypothetical protein